MNARRTYRTAARAQRGFSLIEILIVVALIALIAGMVANQVFGGKYVAKRYSSVPDSLVSVSSGEIKSFYNAHKEMFKQSPSRTLVM